MKSYTITFNEKSKKAKELLELIKKLANENSIFLEEIAVSPTYKKPYNSKTQKAIKIKKTHKVSSVDELFNSI